MTMAIAPYAPEHRAAVLALSLRAWAPVFPHVEQAVPDFVFANFYPKGWEERQLQDLGAFLDAEGQAVWLAWKGDALLGWVGLRTHAEDRMGEIYVLAVDPAAQRRGVAKALLNHGFAQLREAGLAMVMVETGDDPGHAPSRATYEQAGFERWPVARYFRPL